MLDIEWVSPTSFSVQAQVTIFPSPARLQASPVESLLRFYNGDASGHSGLLTEACALDETWALPADARLETLMGSDSSSADFSGVHHALPVGGPVQVFRPLDYYDGAGYVQCQGKRRYLVFDRDIPSH